MEYSQDDGAFDSGLWCSGGNQPLSIFFFQFRIFKLKINFFDYLHFSYVYLECLKAY